MYWFSQSPIELLILLIDKNRDSMRVNFIMYQNLTCNSKRWQNSNSFYKIQSNTQFYFKILWISINIIINK